MLCRLLLRQELWLLGELKDPSTKLASWVSAVTTWSSVAFAAFVQGQQALLLPLHSILDSPAKSNSFLPQLAFVCCAHDWDGLANKSLSMHKDIW